MPATYPKPSVCLRLILLLRHSRFASLDRRQSSHDRLFQSISASKQRRDYWLATNSFSALQTKRCTTWALTAVQACPPPRFLDHFSNQDKRCRSSYTPQHDQSILRTKCPTGAKLDGCCTYRSFPTLSLGVQAPPTSPQAVLPEKEVLAPSHPVPGRAFQALHAWRRLPVDVQQQQMLVSAHQKCGCIASVSACALSCTRHTVSSPPPAPFSRY